MLRYCLQAGASRNGRRRASFGRLVALRPRECRQKAGKVASLPPTGTGIAPPPALRALGGGAGERDKARAGKGHVPRCQITKVMSTKYAHPHTRSRDGVLVPHTRSSDAFGVRQYPTWSWHLKRPKCIWSLRPPESPQVQLEQHSTNSEICSRDVYSKSSANYLESAISSESAHFLSHASVVLVQLALAFGYRSGSSSNSIWTYQRPF